MPIPQIRGGVFDQDAASETGLHRIGIAANDIERFPGHRQRQEVGEIMAAHYAPRQVLGDEFWFEPSDQISQALQMVAVDPLGTAEREPDAVEGQGVVAPDAFEVHEWAAAAKIILRMDLKPADRGTRFEDRLMVLEAQPDPRAH